MRVKQLSRVLWLTAAFTMQASAAGKAVQSTHYQASVTGRLMEADDATDGDKSEFLGASGEITLPLGQHFGVEFGLGYEDSDRPSDYVDLEGETFYGMAGVFARDPALGRVGLIYDRARFDYTATFKYVPYYFGQQESDKLDIWAVTLMGEVYSEQVTVGFSQSRAETTRTDERDNVTTVYADWYLTDNLLLDLRASLDSSDDEETYVADVEYQPEFLQSSTSFRLGYVRASDMQGFRLGVTFYFDKRFDLKTRDRHYR